METIRSEPQKYDRDNIMSKEVDILFADDVHMKFNSYLKSYVWGVNIIYGTETNKFITNSFK